MPRRCADPDCGRSIDKMSSRAKYCSDTCRARAFAARAAGVGVAPPDSGDGGVLVAVTTATLESVDRLETVAGQAALDLARTISSGNTPATAKAALHKQLLATMEEAMRGTRAAHTSVDDLRARRDAKRAAAG